ncbi:hypothetical protein BGZ52_008700, partial [Haplosporangium bisporale]
MRDEVLYERYTDCLMAHIGRLTTLQELKQQCGLYRMTLATGRGSLGPFNGAQDGEDPL